MLIPLGVMAKTTPNNAHIPHDLKAVIDAESRSEGISFNRVLNEALTGKRSHKSSGIIARSRGLASL